MKKKTSLLTYNEWTILRILWSSDHAMARPEIMQNLPTIRDWQPTAISTLITSMIEKGLLRVDGVTRCGRGYGRTYAATMPQFDFIVKNALALTLDIPEGERVIGLITSLLNRNELDPEDLEAVEQLIAAQKEKVMKKEEA